MTAIVGLVGLDGTVYIGGDSAGTTDSGDQSTFLNPKVFFPERGPWFLVGAAGSFRASQVLHHSFTPPLPPKPGADIYGYMVTEFVEALRECFEENGVMGESRDGRGC